MKDMVKGLILLLCLVCCQACIYTENVFPSKTFQISFDKNSQLELISGEITIIDSTRTDFIADITFHQVNGGKTFLFGITSVNEVNGYKEIRLRVLKDHRDTGYSINDLTTIKTHNDIIQL